MELDAELQERINVIQGQLDAGRSPELIGDEITQKNMSATTTLTEKYKQFWRQLKEGVFLNEPSADFELPGYIYREPSYTNPHFFYLLNEVYHNGRTYNNPQDLRAAMVSLLEGKKILEIGCGPGFFLPVLEGLGVDAYGIEQEVACQNQVPGVKIAYRTAQDCLPGIRTKFDIVYSADLLCQNVMSSDTTVELMRSSEATLTTGGLAIHTVSMLRIPPELKIWMHWYNVDRCQGKTLQYTLDSYFQLSSDFRRSLLYSNQPHFDEKLIQKAGCQTVLNGQENDSAYLIMRGSLPDS